MACFRSFDQLTLLCKILLELRDVDARCVAVALGILRLAFQRIDARIGLGGRTGSGILKYFGGSDLATLLIKILLEIIGFNARGVAFAFQLLKLTLQLGIADIKISRSSVMNRLGSVGLANLSARFFSI